MSLSKQENECYRTGIELAKNVSTTSNRSIALLAASVLLGCVRIAEAIKENRKEKKR